MGGTCCKFNGATGPLGTHFFVAAKPTQHSKQIEGFGAGDECGEVRTRGKGH